MIFWLNIFEPKRWVKWGHIYGLYPPLNSTAFPTHFNSLSYIQSVFCELPEKYHQFVLFIKAEFFCNRVIEIDLSELKNISSFSFCFLNTEKRIKDTKNVWKHRCVWHLNFTHLRRKPCDQQYDYCFQYYAIILLEHQEKTGIALLFLHNCMEN